MPRLHMNVRARTLLYFSLSFFLLRKNNCFRAFNGLSTQYPQFRSFILHPPQMMLLALIPSVFLLLLEQCVYEVYEMDPETSGVPRYLLLICVDLTSNIARAPPCPVPHISACFYLKFRHRSRFQIFTFDCSMEKK